MTTLGTDTQCHRPQTFDPTLNAAIEWRLFSPYALVLECPFLINELLLGPRKYHSFQEL